MTEIPWPVLIDHAPIAGAALALVGLLLRFAAWRLRVRDVQAFNAALAAAPSEETREVIRSNPPPPPGQDLTRLGVLLLLLSGAAIGVPLAQGATVAEDGNAERCDKSADCGPGCICRDGQCRCAATDRKRPPRRPQKSDTGPRSSSSLAALPARRLAGDPTWSF